MLIILDPGHGGNDPGAVGNGLQEKDINLKLALLTYGALLKYRTWVVLTRPGDFSVGIGDRAALANRVEADYFCSLHVNAGGGTGFESYIHPAAPAVTAARQAALHRRVASFYRQYGMPDRGMKKAPFAVLEKSTMPAVLLENLFIDSKRDAALLRDENFLRGLAGAVAAGLAAALQLQRLPED